MSPRIAVFKRIESVPVGVLLSRFPHKNIQTMTTSTLYHTQGTYGFQYKKTERKGQTEYYYLFPTASHLNCPCCGSNNTSIHQTKQLRQVRGVPIGLKKRLFVSR